jgi:hypothetical protein
MDNNNNNTTGAQLVDNLKLAVQFSWYQPGLILDRLELWSDVLAECFEHALQDDWRHVVALPANVTGPRGITEDTVESVLDNFNDWLGRHVIYEILAAEVDA